MASYDECLIEAELRARAAYAEPHRHYHSERHHDDCLRLLDEVRDLSEREQRLLRWAILWHDAVYEPEVSDNEERSAELALRELTACGVTETDAEEVARLILLTKEHAADEQDGLGALLVSIDLSILGSDADRYADYSASVRREYAHLPHHVWRKGRAGVLKRLLAADPLYPDPDFRGRFEAQAQRNMVHELKTLAES